MALTDSIAAYDDCFQAFERAAKSKKGIRILFDPVVDFAQGKLAELGPVKHSEKILLGVFGLKQVNADPNPHGASKAMAITGIVVGAIQIVIAALLVVAIAADALN